MQEDYLQQAQVRASGARLDRYKQMALDHLLIQPSGTNPESEVKAAAT